MNEVIINQFVFNQSEPSATGSNAEAKKTTAQQNSAQQWMRQWERQAFDQEDLKSTHAAQKPPEISVVDHNSFTDQTLATNTTLIETSLEITAGPILESQNSAYFQAINQSKQSNLLPDLKLIEQLQKGFNLSIDQNAMLVKSELNSFTFEWLLQQNATHSKSAPNGDNQQFIRTNAAQSSPAQFNNEAFAYTAPYQKVHIQLIKHQNQTISLWIRDARPGEQHWIATLQTELQNQGIAIEAIYLNAKPYDQSR